MTLPVSYNEKELLLQIAVGDETSFNIVFDKYRLPVYVHVLSLIKSPMLAEEITQDVFIQVWNKRTELSEINSFPDWLFIITRNRSFSELRKKIPSFQEVPDEMLPNAEDPLNGLLFKETSQLLQKAIAQLPPRRQQIFIMSRIENKSHKEIATALGITPGTVNLQLVQALAALRTILHNTEKENKNFPGEYIYTLLAASLIT